MIVITTVNSASTRVKNVDILSLNEAKNGIKLMKEAGMEKINVSGGEPSCWAGYVDTHMNLDWLFP